ncbi:hypothetical protein [Nocardia sp. alder85J]|uniref:hypothetical protein n=1 Tax=Nocardia sp. alder85J TaxID=2862949 RepID=UPI001CD60811|nr:hypothetical protein [Nocardia sp. alder85J]MCX4091327.1 hypothetical protein [Nocardia sp. alder85J]
MLGPAVLARREKLTPGRARTSVVVVGAVPRVQQVRVPVSVRRRVSRFRSERMDGEVADAALLVPILLD